jgi:hypothetical protein
MQPCGVWTDSRACASAIVSNPIVEAKFAQDRSACSAKAFVINGLIPTYIGMAASINVPGLSATY